MKQALCILRFVLLGYFGATAFVPHAEAAAQKYEAEATAADHSNWCMGYNLAQWTSAAEAGASGGAILSSTANGAILRVVFGGSGVSLVHKQVPQAGTLNWTLDGGAQSGQIDQNGTLQQQKTVVIAAQGSLPNTLHVLELTCSAPGTSGVNVDAVIVQDNQRTRLEQDQTPPFSYGNWQDPQFSDATAEPSGGTLGYASAANASITLPFSGVGIALLEYHRGDYGRYQWSIDGGARSGVVDLAQTSGGGLDARWPRLLANDLTPGAHTLRITTLDNKTIVIDGADVSNGGTEPAAAWTQERGLYIFSNNGYLPPYAPRTWTQGQWATYLLGLRQMGINHLQLPRAPWSERPAQTQAETDSQNNWRGVLQSARSLGMTTSLIFQATVVGTPAQAWIMRSPNNPSTANWAKLTDAYAQWATIYGDLVDEWHTGAEDPGGCPVCAGLNWFSYAATPQCSATNPVCTIEDYVALLEASRSAVRAVNPGAKVVAHAWGLPWWGKDAGYATQLASFVAKVPGLPADIELGAAAQDNPQTDALQATGRPVQAWPFYLIGHEFCAGLTKLHLGSARSYLQTMRAQGMTKVITHISQPIEMLPAVFYYAKMLEDTGRTDVSIMREFASNLVDGSTNQAALADALIQLGKYWDSVSGVANWEIEQMRPINATPPYAKRYTGTQLGYLDTAVSKLASVGQIKSVPTLAMIITPTEWIGRLREQANALRDAARMDEAIAASYSWLDDQYALINAAPEPLTRAQAQNWVASFSNVGALAKMRGIREYLQVYLASVTGTKNPLGEIYDYLLAFVPHEGNPENLGLAGDYLELNAPSHGRVLARLEGRTDDLETNFCWVNAGLWSRESLTGYHSGSAMISSTVGAETRILFAGTGVALLHSTLPQGTLASWSIDGNVASGQINMQSASRADKTLSGLAQNLTPGLHVLTIRHAGTSGKFINIDGIEVQGNSRWRLEEGRSDFAYSADQWVTSTDPVYSADSQHYTTTLGAKTDLQFAGRGVAVTVTRRTDYGVMAWKIDNGAGGSGTINLAQTASFRYPLILANDLSDGTHTLTLTHQSGFLSNIDSVDTWRTLPEQTAVSCSWAAAE